MTCIVGITDGKTTWIGGDSLGSNGYSKVVRADKKVFKLQDTTCGIIGYTSSFRMGQLLMYASNLIDTRDEPNIDHKYVVTKFIPNVIHLFESGGFNRTNSGEKSGGNFLLGYKNKLYHIENDYQVGESIDGYDACGSGESFALGSLKTTEDSKLSPVERIHKALQAASKFSIGVEAPFYILNTDTNEVIKFDE